jgi:protein-S-isoprenylcysteine O-methyltransferase Ste14
MESVTIFQVVAFILASIVITTLSWRSLGNPRSHGFYRFFAFESILVIVLQGFYLLRKIGGSTKRQDSPETFAFENTANLVTVGIYKFIRHPLYSSLLLLAWGAYLKHITIYVTIAGIVATAALVATAKMDERECLLTFGSAYEAYMKKTKRFIPFLF